MDFRCSLKRFMIVVPLLIVVGCAQEVIPEHLEGQVNRELRFVEIKEHPESHRGKLVLVGGKALSVTRSQDGTRIEVLQRPLSKDLMPEVTRDSHGRFVAMDVDNRVIDPAVLETSTLLTVVGEVEGTDRVEIDGVEKKVPKLRIRHVTVWDRDALGPYDGYDPPFAWVNGKYYPYPF